MSTSNRLTIARAYRTTFASRGSNLVSRPFVATESKRRQQLASTRATETRKQRVDVAIVGSGIIALFVAHELLERTGLTVAVVERATTLCAGATGAGQGYLWSLHRDPLHVDSWQMAQQGIARWREIAAADPAFSIDTNGSLLLATTPEERDELEARVTAVNQALTCERQRRKDQPLAVFLPTRSDVVKCEPRLHESFAPILAGAKLASDCQIDGQATTRALFAKCSLSSRFVSYFGSSVEHLIFQSGAVKGIYCTGGLEIAAGAVCVCAGAWSSTLLSSWLNTGEERWHEAIIPRRGHLLVVRPSRKPRGRLLTHGIMESSYSKYYKTRPGNKGGCDGYDVTFTATENRADGTLLIGSSRELGEFDQVVNPRAVKDIMDAARAYLPSLLVGSDVIGTRVGLRPFSPTGPIIGPVEGVDNLYIAAGHEGSGLTLAPVTAERVLRLLGNLY